jgi:ATP-binding protein involved in chromosome partitioning
LDGAIIVTTPQPAATNIARKGGLMFQKVNVPLIGIAENMSYFVDPSGGRHEVFGHGGGLVTAEKLGTSLLGRVPLLTQIREAGDAGTPIVVQSRESEAARTFGEIAAALLERLAHPATPRG